MPQSLRSGARAHRRRLLLLLVGLLVAAAVIMIRPFRPQPRPQAPAPVAQAAPSRSAVERLTPCPPEMAQVGTSCVDRYEGSLVIVLANGRTAPFPPYDPPDGHDVRAVSYRSVVPQAHISLVQVRRACAAAGKRACRVDEWKRACKGPRGSRYPYGDKREPGACNDSGRAPVPQLYYGVAMFDRKSMNDPRLNQMPQTVAKTGTRQECTNEYGVYDMVGNLHEWLDDGAFHGGYYLDVTTNREGCDYVTVRHEEDYRDYSTGFRCCKDAIAVDAPSTSASSP